MLLTLLAATIIKSCTVLESALKRSSRGPFLNPELKFVLTFGVSLTSDMRPVNVNHGKTCIKFSGSCKRIHDNL